MREKTTILSYLKWIDPPDVESFLEELTLKGYIKNSFYKIYAYLKVKEFDNRGLPKTVKFLGVEDYQVQPNEVIVGGTKISKLTGLTTGQVRYTLNFFVEEGFLEKINFSNSKGTHYKIANLEELKAKQHEINNDEDFRYHQTEFD